LEQHHAVILDDDNRIALKEMREIQVRSMTTFTEPQNRPRQDSLESRTRKPPGGPYKTNTCQEQGLVLKNVGSVVVEPGKRATDKEGFVGICVCQILRRRLESSQNAPGF
jgi:hypothetical protein